MKVLPAVEIQLGYLFPIYLVLKGECCANTKRGGTCEVCKPCLCWC